MLILSAIGAFAAGGLRVTPVSGEPVVFLFDDRPEVSFIAGKLQVKTAMNNTPVVFELDDIDSIDFSGETSISDIEASAEIAVTIDSRGVHFLNVPAGATASVFTLNGITVISTTVGASTFDIDRSQLAAGVYIVKINNFVTKIAL